MFDCGGMAFKETSLKPLLAKHRRLHQSSLNLDVKTTGRLALFSKEDLLAHLGLGLVFPKVIGQ